MTTTYWQDFINYLKTDAQLNEWLSTGDEARALETISLETQEDWKLILTYEGFDIMRILRLVYANHKAHTAERVEYSIEIVKNGAPATVTYSNKETLGQDIHFCLSMFAIRGCCWDKIKKKTDKTTVTILDMLIEKLGITTEVGQQNQARGPDDITVPRIAACFPSIMCNLFHSGTAKLLVSLEQVGLPETESRALVCPNFASCIPKSWVNMTENVNLLFFLVHLHVDNLLHRSDKSYTDLKDIFTYYRAAYDSVGMSQIVRQKYCVGMSLGNATNTAFKAVIAAAALGAEAKIRAARPDDPELSTVIGLLKALKE